MSSKLFTLTRDDHQRIIEAERSLHDSLALMDQFESCGFECDEIRQAATELLQRLAKLRDTFKSKGARNDT